MDRVVGRRLMNDFDSAPPASVSPSPGRPGTRRGPEFVRYATNSVYQGKVAQVNEIGDLVSVP